MLLWPPATAKAAAADEEANTIFEQFISEQTYVHEEPYDSNSKKKSGEEDNYSSNKDSNDDSKSNEDITKKDSSDDDSSTSKDTVEEEMPHVVETIQVETVHDDDEEDEDEEDEDEDDEEIPLTRWRTSTRIKERQAAAAKERKRASLLRERASVNKVLIDEATELGTQIRRAAKKEGKLGKLQHLATRILERKGSIQSGSSLPTRSTETKKRSEEAKKVQEKPKP